MKRGWNLPPGGGAALRLALLALPVAAGGAAAQPAAVVGRTTVPSPAAEAPAARVAPSRTGETPQSHPEGCRERCIAPDAVQAGEAPAIVPDTATTGSDRAAK